VTEAPVDVVVIGAGIHGAGVAQAAAARGHSVLVLESREVAAGTSRRSTKLIHGGLRYLETGRFSLVRECLREQRLLLRLAPALVRPLPFHVPVYRHSRRRPWQLWLGLSAYALLGGLGQGTGFTRVARRRWPSLDGLDVRGLCAVFRYWDAQTDDAALTRAVMDSACDLGAELCVPARFLAGERIGTHYRVRYSHHGAELQCRARTVVNAAGPWVNEVMDAIAPPPRKMQIDLVQGAHLVLDASLERGAYYVEAPRDGRAVFILPWKGRLMVGTTESPFHGRPGDVTPLAEEIDYLRNVLAHYFPGLAGRHAPPTVDAFAGLRVLPTGSGDAAVRPRDTVLLADDDRSPRLVAIYGGKLTAYRATADRVMDRLAPGLPAPAPRADTRTLRLAPAKDT
jgi:glycerol-3-phosphate dehydrogenase